jgi:hypothetical protein
MKDHLKKLEQEKWCQQTATGRRRRSAVYHLPQSTSAGRFKRHQSHQQTSARGCRKGLEYRKHSWSDVIAADKRERLEKIAATLSTYQRIEKEVFLRLPAKDGTLCLSCHELTVISQSSKRRKS